MRAVHAAFYHQPGGPRDNWRCACRCGWFHFAPTKKGARGWYLLHKLNPSVTCPAKPGTRCNVHGYPKVDQAATVAAMTIGHSLCQLCSRIDFDGVAEINGITTGTCTAFPEGIPLRIFSEGFDHRKPFRGDGGVRFDLDTTIATEADVDGALGLVS